MVRLRSGLSRPCACRKSAAKKLPEETTLRRRRRLSEWNPHKHLPGLAVSLPVPHREAMFQPLAQVLSEIKDRVDSAERVNLFLDFDGTAVPISADFSAPG